MTESAGAATAPPRPAPAPRRFGLIWLLLAALAVAPVAVTLAGLDHPPFQDHPSHRVKNLVLLRYHLDPQSREFYRLNVGWPYQLSDYILVAMARGLGLDTAYRIYYAILYLGGFLLAYWYLLRAYAIAPAYLLWGVFLAFNTYLFHGTENWMLGIVFALLALAALKRGADDPRPRTLLLELPLLVILYYTHVVAFLLVLLQSLVLLPLTRTALQRRAAAILLVALLTGITRVAAGAPLHGQEWQVVFFTSWREQMDLLLIALGGYWLAGLPWFAQAPFWILAALLPLLAAGNRSRPQAGRVFGVALWWVALLAPRGLGLGRHWGGPDAEIEAAIYAIGQRVVYFGFLTLPLVLPDRRWCRGLVAAAMLAYLPVVVPGAIELLTVSAQSSEPIIAECEQLGLDLRGEWVYPILLPPYTDYSWCHRLPAYAYAVGGGTDRHQFFFGQMVVVWRRPPPVPLPAWVTPTNAYRLDLVGDETLAAYRTIIVIGCDNRAGYEWVGERLAPLGFTVVRQRARVAVLQRPAPAGL